MLKKKKLYRVYDEDKLYRKKQIDFLHGIWCTDNLECRNMGMTDAFNNSEYISGCVIDESIKDCLIFIFSHHSSKSSYDISINVSSSTE